MCQHCSSYGLDVCTLNKNDIASLDFVVNQFFMKLFFTSDINIVSECQQMFNFRLPSEQTSVVSTVCDAELICCK